MITFLSSNVKGQFEEDSNHPGEFNIVPTIPIVNINEEDGFKLLKLLHLPRLNNFELEPDQLPAFKSMIQDHIGFEQPIEKISTNTARYGDKASNTVSYFHRKLKELYELVDICIKSDTKLQWQRR